MKKIKSVVLPLLAALIWGIAFVAQADSSAPTFIFNAVRSWIAVPFLVVLLLVVTRGDVKNLLREETAEGTKNLWLGGFLCGVTLFIATFLQQYGMDQMPQGTGAGKSGFITAFYMILVPVSGLLLFGQKNKLKIWVGAALAIVGLYFLCIEDGFTIGVPELYVLGCSLFFTAQIHIIDRFSTRCNCVRLSCVQFITMAVLSTLSALVFESGHLADLGGIIRDNLVPLLYLGVFSSGVAYTLQMIAQRGTNPTVVSILLSMESVFSVLAGAVIKHDALTPRAYIGCVLMFAAVMITQLDFPLKKTKNKAGTA